MGDSNQSYEKLKKLIDQIDELKKRERFSPEFHVWKGSVVRFLAKTWNNEPEYLKPFNEITYAVKNIIPNYEQLYEKEKRCEVEQDIFNDGLQRAKLLLTSFLDDIPNEIPCIVEGRKSNPLEKEKIQKSLTLLNNELLNAESGPDKNTFGLKNRLKEIFKDLTELEPRIIAEYSDIDKLVPLESYDALDYTRGDSGMAQLLKSRVNKLLIETNYDQSQQPKIKIEKIQILENILEKFPRVVRQLKERRKEKGVTRTTLEVNDEFDVQDLLYAILKINFEVVKREIGTEYHVGGTGRIDLVLDNEEIVIEVKMVRKDHTLRSLGDELIIDIERYLDKYSCKFLYFFIYDPTDLLPNLQELVKDINRTKNGVDIRVVFAPRK